MKTIFTIMMLCGVMCGYAQNTPPHAASTRTWTFGEQTWSDAIHCPECDKGTFEESNDDPQCRSYTYEGKTFYYYNWAYVNANKERICPSPWRVPEVEDFDLLDSNTTYSTLINAWGYGGEARGSNVYDVILNTYYWSSTEYSDSLICNLYCGCCDVSTQVSNKYYGYQVRCVK
jgi:hypothetical protein